MQIVMTLYGIAKRYLVQTGLFNRASVASGAVLLALVQASVIVLSAGIGATNAHAAPPLRYTAIVQEGASSSFPISVSSRAEACTVWVERATPDWFFISATPAPDWDVPSRYENISNIHCLTVTADGTDIRTAGYAHCSVTWQTSSTFVVDKTTEACVCPAGTQTFPDKPETCVAVTAQTGTSAPPNDPANNGPSCHTDPKKNQPSCGEPINPGTGNMWHIERDYAAPSPSSDLTLSRVYNSSPYNWDASTARTFGTRWTYPYDAVLRPEEAFLPNGSPGNCWRREDTLYIWCDSPPLPVPSAIPEAVSILRGDGKKFLFNRSGDDWIGKADTNDRINPTYNEDRTAVIAWTYVAARGDVTERYSATGVLLSISARNGTTQRLTYSDGMSNDSSAGRSPADAPVCAHVQQGALLPAGRLMCVTDHYGRQLNFEYDTAGRIVKAIDPGNQGITYEYDGPSGGCPMYDPNNVACTASNLTKVTYPDGKRRTYYYNEAAQINGAAACTNAIEVGNGFAHLINSWTGLVDENEARYISWTYDCLGRATSSQLGSGIEKVTIDYLGGSGRTITHFVGIPDNPQTKVASYYYGNVLGVSKNTSIPSPCAECGDFKERLYDANGNITSLKNWNTQYICYAYDLSRNLETVRVEGGGGVGCTSMLAATTLSGVARKTSTQWHPTFNLPLAIAAPKRLTTYSYDASGNLLTLTETATSDTTGIQGFGAPPVGIARTWTYTVNAVGQVLTATGPRTDVNDTTSYVYDSEGNLVTVTNAAGHVTTLSNYDANGRVRRIVSPNGTITEMGYTPRGWLSWRSVKASGITEITGYEYDGAGQLTKVALPGGAAINYQYDDAHRLTRIYDELGNAILYTLDLRGNRVEEKITDPSGVLTRKVSRVYDTIGRLQQQTGGVQ